MPTQGLGTRKGTRREPDQKLNIIFISTKRRIVVWQFTQLARLHTRHLRGRVTVNYVKRIPLLPSTPSRLIPLNLLCYTKTKTEKRWNWEEIYQTFFFSTFTNTFLSINSTKQNWYFALLFLKINTFFENCCLLHAILTGMELKLFSFFTLKLTVKRQNYWTQKASSHRKRTSFLFLLKFRLKIEHHEAKKKNKENSCWLFTV